MAKNLLQKLKDGEVIYGTCIVSTAPIWSKSLTQSLLDYVFLDTEHIPMDRNELTMLCQVYKAIGLSTIVRIPSPDPFLACMAKDAGATGVLAPYIEDVDQIKQMVGACKYRPLKGKRLTRVLDGSETLEPELIDYLRKYNEGSMCLINIESMPAVEHLSALLDVSGLDAVIIGPHDLSINMGLPEQYDHPEYEKVVRKIVHQVREKGIAAGIHFPEKPERQIKWIKEGVNIVMHSSDIRLFNQKLNEDITRIKEAVGENKPFTENADLTI
jgi:4-hydroxy-2-oxoheptanedioate aldolase